MDKAQYVVTRTLSFDAETECTIFNDYNHAKAYLHWLWEDYYNTEIAEGSGLVEESCYHEDEYAVVEWEDGCKCEFYLMVVGSERPEFQEVDWIRYL